MATDDLLSFKEFILTLMCDYCGEPHETFDDVIILTILSEANAEDDDIWGDSFKVIHKTCYHELFPEADVALESYKEKKKWWEVAHEVDFNKVILFKPSERCVLCDEPVGVGFGRSIGVADQLENGISEVWAHYCCIKNWNLESYFEGYVEIVEEEMPIEEDDDNPFMEINNEFLFWNDINHHVGWGEIDVTEENLAGERLHRINTRGL